MTSPVEIAKADETIRGILAHPPQQMDQLERRLGGVDPEAGREVLLMLYTMKEMVSRHRDLLLALGSVLELARDPHPLLEMAGDPRHCDATRKVAMMLLMAHNPRSLDISHLPLDRTLMSELAEDTDILVLRGALEHPDTEVEVTGLLEEVPLEHLSEAFDHLEQARRELAAPAWLVYRNALGSQALIPLHDTMIRIIRDETQASGLDVWDDLLSPELPPATRTGVQEAMMRWRTSRINGRKGKPPVLSYAPQVTAWINPCDGVGAYVLLVRVAQQRGGFNIHNVCLRTTGELRDGFVLAHHPAEEFERMLQAFSEATDQTFVRCPLSVAAELVQEARLSPLNQKGSGMGENLRAAAALQWAVAVGRADSLDHQLSRLPEPQRPPDFTDTELEDLFQELETETWFLNAADLAGFGIETKPMDQVDHVWLDDQVDRLNTPAVREKLSSMFSHLAWYCQWDGEKERAAEYAGVVDLLADDEDAFPVLLFYLLNSLEAAEANEMARAEPQVLSIGDFSLRAVLRQKGFPRLSHPKGKHLAMLDLAEAAFVAVELVVADFPIDRQPRQDVLPQIALAIGKAHADNLLGGGELFDLPADERRYRRMINAICKDSGLKRDEAQKLWQMVVPHTRSFLEGICGRCPVDCWDRPTGNVEGLFYGAEHPAFLNPDL